jgi:hypothetical protein
MIKIIETDENVTLIAQLEEDVGSVIFVYHPKIKEGVKIIYCIIILFIILFAVGSGELSPPIEYTLGVICVI